MSTVHVAIAVVAAHPHVVRAAVAVHIHVVRHLIRHVIKAIRWLAALLLGRKPKIAVVTPTWKRHDLLIRRCIPSVLAQDYGGEIEHIIVSDGPDEMLAGVPGVRFLPVHVTAPNRGIYARRHGADLADADLIAYLDDDNAWRPDHLSLLADAIAREDVSFAYSQALCRNPEGVYWVVGCPRPVFGQIDTSLIVHTRGLLETANWEPSGRPADWDLVDRWLQAGARYAHVPAITLDYYAHDPDVEPCLTKLAAGRLWCSSTGARGTWNHTGSTGRKARRWP